MINPFRQTIVASPWENQTGNVPGIHEEVFNACLSGIEHVRQAGRSAALTIHGEAGSGKTHLLSRLRSQLTPQAPVATDRNECLYIWVRLQTSPRMIWRTLRRTLVEDWFRPVAEAHSQFDRILFHRLAEIRVAEGDLEPWYEYMLQDHPEGLRQLLDQISESLYLDRNTAIAFEHIAFGRHRRDLRAWLSGDSLPEEALDRLGLSQDEGTDEEREDEAQRVVLMLCRLAGGELPILLSFDQVEALQMGPQDTEGLFAFGKLVSILHDQTQNVLIVSCVQSAFFNTLKDRSRHADRDRMASLGAWSLHPLSRAQAEQVIQARLESSGPDRVKPSDASAIWPLTEADLDHLYSQSGAVTPRLLLNLCAEKFDQSWPGLVNPQASEEPVDPMPRLTEVVPTPARSREEVLDEFLNESWRNGVEEKLNSNAPEQTEEIIRHGLPLLLNLLTPERKLVSNEQLPDVSLVYGGDAKLGVSVCTQPNMTSLSGRLRRLQTQFTPANLQRLVIVRDPRAPLSSGAKKAKEYLEQLQEKGAIIVHPTPAVLAALDALRALLSDAKSGDLSCSGETIPPRTVEQWLLQNLSECLRSFVDEVIGVPETSARDAAADSRRLESLQTLLADQPVMPLSEVAEALQESSEELVKTIQRHPDRFGLLGDSSSVLFKVVSHAARQ